MTLLRQIAGMVAGFVTLGCKDGVTFPVGVPRAARVDTFFIQGPTAFDGITYKPFGVTEGRLRIAYAAEWNCPREGMCIAPGTLKLTNEFVVRVER